jgi:archaeal flagellar protein FlaI
MPTITLPFKPSETVKWAETDGSPQEILGSLPGELQKAVNAYPHLFAYMTNLIEAKISIPEYYPELNRSLAAKKELNIIYPVKNAGSFVHILSDESGDRSFYIPVEPTTTMDVASKVQAVDDACIAISYDFTGIDPNQEKEKKLLEYVDKVTSVVSYPAEGLSDKPSRTVRYPFFRKKAKMEKVKVTPHELEAIKYSFLRDKIGLDVLQPLIEDPYIEDISCSGMGNVFIEHKIFKSLKSTITFSDFEELDDFVIRLAERIKKPVTYKNPIADATLPDGSRINIVFGRDVSKRGSNFSIRKFSEVPLSIFEIADFGTVNYQMLAYLYLAINNGMNIFVAGESASGKTALINAITTFISPTAKIITIEDTPELQIPQTNWIREVVQTTKAVDAGGAVTMFDLLKAALRQRPNEIIVGEIRGVEGSIAFQAMQTGHSVMATFHAASIEKLIQRITGDPILVPKTYIDNLNVAVIMGMVKLPNGKIGRRVTNISEIVGWDPSSESFNIVEAFRWDEATDKFDFTGYMTSYILESKIAPKLGIASNNKQKIYYELEKRAKVLSKLHQEKGVTGFYDVLEVLSKAQREGLF